jgi:hypothetical protein
MTNIDLDALAGVAQPITITWKGESFRLMDDLDLGTIRPILKDLDEAVQAAEAGAKNGLEMLDVLSAFVRACFYDEATFDRFQATHPGPQVLMALTKELPKAYGFETLGEVVASSGGSPDTGTGSTPTSDGSIPGSEIQESPSGAAWPTSSKDLAGEGADTALD